MLHHWNGELDFWNIAGRETKRTEVSQQHIMASSIDTIATTGGKPQSNSLHDTLKALSSRGNKRKRPESKEDALNYYFSLKERHLVSSSSITPRSTQAVVIVTKVHNEGRSEDGKKQDNSSQVEDSDEKPPTTTDELKEVNNDNDVGESAEEVAPAEEAETNAAEESKADDVSYDIKKKKEDAVTVTLHFEAQDDSRYKYMEEEQARALDGIEMAKQRVFNDQTDLWGVYKYGLQHVLNLNDLTDAPDAILPGNF